jgi:murein DD-endopeptidase MepM/ murein hydrolase activator NlpD
MVNSPGLLSRRYSILVADRSTGVVRRFNLSLRPALATVIGVFTLPVLVGLGARWSASAELDHLRTATGVLRQENASFRTATGELTGQIAQLQDAIGALSEVGQLDPATRTALSTLPALVRNQAKGGAAASADTKAIVAAATRSPEDAFGLLRSALGSLERHLSVTRADVLQRNEVAQATPSIWPAMGWLTSGFGSRSDPFTGRPDSHPGLDISGNTGDPVFATADGRVAVAARTGDYGNLVVIEHAFGLTTRYGHLSRIAIAPGVDIKRGAVIGYVGSTGRSTSSHLHYEVWANGRPVNPLKLLVGRPE